ncbi:hypothetical protein [Arthrobacter sp. 7Tela_A1]|uniref:hypothetical protein n=1 Tax=Arthrobacter sp. 7Tela_A1 TaxID=3093745 RepID=UPI003BB55E3B
MGKHRLLASLLSVSVLGCSLAACASTERPAPEDTAGMLADGLSRLDVSGGLFASSTVDAVNGMLAHLVGGMAPLKPTVTVAGVEEISGNEAEATLDWVWDVNASDTDYTYSTNVTLQLGAQNKWETRFRSTTVHADLKPGERLVRQTTTAPRADILGARNAVLVRDTPVWHVGIDKAVLTEREYATWADYLARYLELDPGAYSAKVLAAGPRDFVEANTLRKDRVAASFEADIATIPGAATHSGRQSLASYPSFAQPLLGAVGTAPEELIAATNGELAPGDEAGLSGLQLEYDAQLRGAAAVTVRIANAEQDLSKPLFELPAEPGEPLQTTLDPGLQSLAESALANESSAAALVAVRPSTGGILAAANGPGSKGAQTALLGEYPPGSMFELVTGLAEQRGGEDSPDSVADAARALGIGTEWRLGTAAAAGSVPEAGAQAEQAAVLAGQGDVRLSPLAVAVAGASMARGERVAPLLITPGTEPAESPDTDSVTSGEAAKLRRALLSPGGGAQMMAGTSGSESGKGTHSWALAVDDDLAVAVFIDNGGADPDSAAALLLEIFLAAVAG